jgi:hypothetical protein
MIKMEEGIEINEILNKVILEILPMIEQWWDDELKSKFIEIMGFTDIYKKNRWFGYYQRVGEEKGYFTLDYIIELVRKYKEEYKKKNTIEKCEYYG